MLYEVITLSRVATAFLIPDNHIGRATVSSIAVAHEVALMGGRAVAWFECRVRITSYNVCYTKLLRRMTSDDTPPSPHRNRLADETSPYLLQHADNPVDWYPWGDDAFALAREQGKPVLLSIGYSACHWCSYNFV